MLFASIYGGYIKWVGDKKATFKNGRFQTDDQDLINALLEDKNCTVIAGKPKKVFTCKKCGKTFESNGHLLAHYRHEHKGEADDSSGDSSED